uniref:hypothetical protein n=1 Tax=Enterococcus mundtii TaxID=53346 RepID=UPI0035C6F38E
MSDLENTNNIYANFAQDLIQVIEIPNFPYEELSFSKRKKLWTIINLFISTSQMQKMLMEMI